MNKDNQQENTMRERLVNEGWALQSADEVAQIIEIETALARKEGYQEGVKDEKLGRGLSAKMMK